MDNGAGPVQPLESSPSLGRGILDNLIGGKDSAAGAPASPAYQEPIAQQASVNATVCPNCFSAQGKEVDLKDGVCGVCGYDNEVRGF